MASSAGHPDRPNEDFVGAVPGAAVLLDGAGIPGAEAVCSHGVGWFVQRLSAALLDRLFHEDGADLVDTLAASISTVAGMHRDTCDITSTVSPQAAVAIVRFREERVEYLVLGDIYVVLDLSDRDPEVVTDPREVAVRSQCVGPLRGKATGTAEYDCALASVRDAFRSRRNRPGGFWVAKEDPYAATQAVTGTVTLDSLFGVALLTNGASRLVAPYQVADWRTVLDLARTGGPSEFLRRVREAEEGTRRAGGSTAIYEPDDATIAFCERGDGSSGYKRAAG
jgi:hypothetical protein